MLGKKGIVRDSKVHLAVLEQTAEMAAEVGFVVVDASFSPITGGEGNIEFLHLKPKRWRSACTVHRFCKYCDGSACTIKTIAFEIH